MKAILISCFDWYEKRLKPIREILEQKNFDVKILTSDFDHSAKKYSTKYSEECQYVHVSEYKKNISIERMYSHFSFARSIYAILEKENPDLVYALLPPNSVAKYCIRYKEKHKDKKVIFDVIDMWPESMPLSAIKKTCPYLMWKNLRDKNISKADYAFLECDLYRDELKEYLPSNFSTIHLIKEQTENEKQLIRSIVKNENDSDQTEKTMILGYVGSINNIIDIASIRQIAGLLSKEYQVEVRVIGEGENRKTLLEELEKENVKIKYYGELYEENKKIKILTPCDFALNIMKDSVKVGLTIKSIDYFSYGIPIINNIHGDTWKIVEEKNIGVNFKQQSFLNDIKEYREKGNMHATVLEVYDDLFSKKAFVRQVEKGINEKYV